MGLKKEHSDEHGDDDDDAAAVDDDDVGVFSLMPSKIRTRA